MFETISKNLEKLGYGVRAFENAAQAAEYLRASIHGTTVGIGGSLTVQQLDVTKDLRGDNTVFWHWEPLPGKTPAEMRTAAITADVYLSSVNGIAETGEIVNIDGSCNRISSVFYGHRKVFLIAGRNKIAPSCEAALYRAKNVAAPLNAQRLGRKTPCALKADRCYECQSPERICKGLSILWQKPSGADIEVLLINEDLGF